MYAHGWSEGLRAFAYTMNILKSKLHVYSQAGKAMKEEKSGQSTQVFVSFLIVVLSGCPSFVWKPFYAVPARVAWTYC